jgi:hypothetical protein
VAVVVMAVDIQVFEAELALLDLDAELDSADRVESWLHDPARTAHRLVSVPTAVLVAEALGTTTGAAPAAGPVLPGGAWRVLPDRLLALHPGRRAERLARLRVPVAQHLTLTAVVLEQWGWAQSGGRRRTVRGGRCILGAQHAIYRLGYGTEHTAVEAGRRIQGVLDQRGIREPYPQWNEQPHVTAAQVVGVVRAAAGVT